MVMLSDLVDSDGDTEVVGVQRLQHGPQSAVGTVHHQHRLAWHRPGRGGKQKSVFHVHCREGYWTETVIAETIDRRLGK